MSALVVIEFTVKNAEKLKEYSAQTPAILKKHNGALLLKGKPMQIHGASNSYDTVVVFQFPAKEDALDWYNSAEYHPECEW